MKKKTMSALALSLCLMTAGSAWAATEGVVQEAPPVEMEAAGGAEQASYVPDGSYAADIYVPEWSASETYVELRFDGDIFHPAFQAPELTEGEKVRARELLAAYEAGEATGDGEAVLNPMQDVVVGVYALNPQDYDGEAVYVLLPGTCLTDEQLLSIIDAYHRLGLTFDPDALNCRSCARGGGVEANRFFTEEERTRRTRLQDLIRRGVLTQADGFISVRMEVTLDTRYFNGLEAFTFYPYRSLTDEEMAAMLFEAGLAAQAGEVDFAAVEGLVRRALREELGCPLSMELESVGAQGASFVYTNAQGVRVHAWSEIDEQTGELCSAGAMDWPQEQDGTPERAPEITDAVCVEAAQQYARDVLGRDGLTFAAGGETWTNWGLCVETYAIREDGMRLSLYIGAQDGQVHGVIIEPEEGREAPRNG